MMRWFTVRATCWAKCAGGDEWQKFANSALACSPICSPTPARKPWFMSMEFGQWSEWNVWGDLEWHLLQYQPHQNHKHFIAKLNEFYRSEPALYTQDFDQAGFEVGRLQRQPPQRWCRSFGAIRTAGIFWSWCVTLPPSPTVTTALACLRRGYYKELFNSDSRDFGGSNMGQSGRQVV